MYPFKLETILPRLEEELIWSYVLNLTREKLYTISSQFSVNFHQRSQFNKLVKRRLSGVPLAYLIGRKPFWEDNFIVTEDVLIPRPSTELLVELVLEMPQKNLKVLELGTGSGVIALSLAKKRPYWYIVAAELSYNALQIAITNAALLQIFTVRWVHSNWFQNLNNQKFDLILTNPPYIPLHDTYLKGEIRFEPQKALIGGRTGLKDIKQIIQQAPRHLKNGGILYLEHGYDQKISVEKLFRQHGFVEVENYSDLAGLPRVTKGYWFST